MIRGDEGRSKLESDIFRAVYDLIAGAEGQDVSTAYGNYWRPPDDHVGLRLATPNPNMDGTPSGSSMWVSPCCEYLFVGKTVRVVGSPVSGGDQICGAVLYRTKREAVSYRTTSSSRTYLSKGRKTLM